MDAVEPLFISALQHYAYCPRQFSLIHVEQLWEENRHTAEGRILHERVDSGEIEQRGDLRTERGVLLKSEKYNLAGKMDLLEIKKNGQQLTYFPVEYKKGKPKIQDWDRVQVCAQALCLEEMRDIIIAEGAIWYWEVRHREPIFIDDRLRTVTINVIKQAQELLVNGITPRPIDDKRRCRECSMLHICQPDRFRNDNSKWYVNELFKQ